MIDEALAVQQFNEAAAAFCVRKAVSIEDVACVVAAVKALKADPNINDDDLLDAFNEKADEILHPIYLSTPTEAVCLRRAAHRAT